jgi:hypothetical protein
MSSTDSATQPTKPKSGGLLLLRRRAPLTRRTVAYFCSGAPVQFHSFGLKKLVEKYAQLVKA